MNEELKRLIEEISVVTHLPFDDVARDVQRPFDVTAGDFHHQLQLVPGDGNVSNARIVQLTSDLMNEFAETNSITRFSYSELDRRLRSLEERVERPAPPTEPRPRPRPSHDIVRCTSRSSQRGSCDQDQFAR